MKFGQRLLLTMLALLTLAMASHQAVAALDVTAPCAEASHSSSADDAADSAHCLPCCQVAQALPLAAEAVLVQPVSLSAGARFARHADAALDPSYQPFKPPRLA